MALTEIREHRCTLQYRESAGARAMQLKNKMAVLVMKAGVT
jgi:hypothetical protein